MAQKLRRLAKRIHMQFHDGPGNQEAFAETPNSLISLRKSKGVATTWKLTIRHKNSTAQPNAEDVEAIRTAFAVPSQGAITTTREAQVQEKIGPLRLTPAIVVEIQWGDES